LDKGSKGQSLIGYSVIAALIAVVAIGGLVAMMNTLGMTDNTYNPANHESNPPPGTGIVQSGGSLPGIGTAVLTMASGHTVSLNDFPVDVNELVETSGGAGAIHVLSNSLKSFADQLLAEGEITQEQASLLMQLSSQGHDMAAAQQALESAAATSNLSYQDFLHTENIAYQGDLYSGIGLTRGLGWALGNPGQGIANDPRLGPYALALMTPGMASDAGFVDRAVPGPDLMAFLSLYADAAESGAFSDPLVDAMVTGMAAQIAILSDNAENSLHNRASSPTEILDAIEAEASHANSAGICAAGVGTGINISCP
jgi:polyhydroxyalkanoate synthesis regulator phasin